VNAGTGPDLNNCGGGVELDEALRRTGSAMVYQRLNLVARSLAAEVHRGAGRTAGCDIDDRRQHLERVADSARVPAVELSPFPGTGRQESAIVSLILGSAAVVLPLIGLLAAPFAIAFGIAGRNRARRGSPHGGLATAGLTLGVIALTLCAVIAALGLGLVVASNGQEEQVPVQPAGEPAD
jgi:hypothetical protein